MGQGNGAPSQGAVPSPPSLAVGGLVSGGRYELLEAHGGVAGQSFWKAHDKRLDRPVALVFVDPLPGEQPPGSAAGVLDRTVALTTVYSDGLARVLDVIRGRAGGIVVAEWIPGRSLAESVREPDPETAVAAVWGLSDAATRTEETGRAVGLDSPDRIRLTEDGRAVLAFPGVTADADTRGDVRGLGAVLYALLTGAWPLDLPAGSDGHDPVGGRPPAAPRAGDGGEDDDDTAGVADPATAGSGVPPGSAVLAMRSLDGSSVSSAATVRAMVTDRVGGPVRPGSLRPAGAGAPAAVAGAAPARSGAGSSDPVASTDVHDPADPGHEGGYASGPVEPDPDVQRRRWQIMAGAGALAVVLIAVLSAWMLGAFTTRESDTPLTQQLDAIERAAQASRSAEAGRPAGEEEAAAPETTSASPATPVAVDTATAWQPSSSAGTAENSSDAPNVVDGDRSTSWSSDTYISQIGDGPSAYKPGIGLMLALEDETAVREVELLSEDDGVRFEVRAADSASPSGVDDTTLLGQGTVRDGTATVTIDEPEESEYLLVWIIRLGTAGSQAYEATITEVELSQ